jgi:hypothetical protein
MRKHQYRSSRINCCPISKNLLLGTSVHFGSSPALKWEAFFFCVNLKICLFSIGVLLKFPLVDSVLNGSLVTMAWHFLGWRLEKTFSRYWGQMGKYGRGQLTSGGPPTMTAWRGLTTPHHKEVCWEILLKALSTFLWARLRNFMFHKKAAHVLSSWGIIVFSRRTLICGDRSCVEIIKDYSFVEFDVLTAATVLLPSSGQKLTN